MNEKHLKVRYFHALFKSTGDAPIRPFYIMDRVLGTIYYLGDANKVWSRSLAMPWRVRMTLLWLASPDWRRDEKLGKHTLTHANGKPLLACTVAFFDDSVCFRSFEI